MSFYLDLKLLVLLAIANGVPVLVKDVLGSRLSFPFDGGTRFLDRRPLFGPSKTLRGIVLSLLATTLGAIVLRMEWKIGLMIAGLAMAGDLFSSFLKRRMGLAPSSMTIGLDQVPESLFPLLACVPLLALSLADVAAVTACFFVAELLLSRLLYKVHLRDRPY